MSGHIAPISGVAVSREGLIATAGYDSTLILWSGRREIARASHGHLVNHCVFDASGTVVASASSDYSAALWSVPGLELITRFEGHSDDVEMIALSPDGSRVATASRDRTARVYSRDGELQGVLVGHQGDLNAIEWSVDGRHLITVSDDATVRRWDANTLTEDARFAFDGADADTIVIGADGTIFAGAHDGSIATVRNGAATRVVAHAAGIKRLALNPDGCRLASASYDRQVTIWQVAADGGLAASASFAAPAVVWLRAAAWHGDLLVFGTFGTGYALLDPSNGHWDLTGVSVTHGINAILCEDKAVSTIGDSGLMRVDGRAVGMIGSLCNFLVSFAGRRVTGGQLCTMFDAETGEALHRHRSPLNCAVEFHHQGTTHLLVGSYSGEGLIFRREGDRIVHAGTFALCDNAIKALAFDGHTILAASASGQAVFVAPGDWHQPQILANGHTKIANAAASLPGGGFATVGRDLHLILWRDGTGEHHAVPLTHSLKSMAVCQHAKAIVIGDYSGALCAFDWEGRRWTNVVRPTRWGISSIAQWAPGRFRAASYDGKVYRLELKHGKLQEVRH